MGRAPLFASVPPLAALWLWRELAQQLLVTAVRFEERGNDALARELRFTVDQLEQAAGQLSVRDVASAAISVISVDGETETRARAGVEASGAMRPEITTEEAARRLGLSPRRVRQLIGVDLSGRKAGRTWLVDPGSVDDYLDARSA